jgi:hypothetical protein
VNLFLDGIPVEEFEKFKISSHNSRLLDRINDVFEEWDSAGIAHADYHEYSLEAFPTALVLINNPNISKEKLADSINKIFIHWFDSAYHGTLEECVVVAEKIIKFWRELCAN